MAQQDVSGDIGRAAVDRTSAGQHGGSIGLVLLIAIVLVGAAAGLLLIGRGHAEPYILGFLAVLAMVGVFLLFALAAGILRMRRQGRGEPADQVGGRRRERGIAGHRSAGRVIYANAAYLDLIGATDGRRGAAGRARVHRRSGRLGGGVPPAQGGARRPPPAGGGARRRPQGRARALAAHAGAAACATASAKPA